MFSAARSPFAKAGCAARTIVVQDAMRPYLVGDGATNCRDFHKVFHSLVWKHFRNRRFSDGN